MVGDFMVYPDKIDALLKKSKIEVGDTIGLVSGERVYKGILMPHHEFSREGSVEDRGDFRWRYAA